MPRLFTGIEVPPAIALELSRLRGGLPGARWIDPPNYHITLRFIGDVDYGVARDVLSVLGKVRDRSALTITLDEIASFGGQRPRAVFAKVRPTSELMDLQAEQERLLRRVGIEPETRKFTPHVTLARLRREAGATDVAHYIAALGRVPKLTFTADRYVLFSSRDSVGGGPYVVEAAFPLGKTWFEAAE
jgi:2'-5' RNA ligase